MMEMTLIPMNVRVYVVSPRVVTEFYTIKSMRRVRSHSKSVMMAMLFLPIVARATVNSLAVVIALQVRVKNAMMGIAMIMILVQAFVVSLVVVMVY